jgi:hypothetical protein
VSPDSAEASNNVHANVVQVFHYSIQPKANDQRVLIMWDYNIGLVRMTGLFKHFGHSKVRLEVV